MALLQFPARLGSGLWAVEASNGSMLELKEPPNVTRNPWVRKQSNSEISPEQKVLEGHKVSANPKDGSPKERGLSDGDPKRDGVASPHRAGLSFGNAQKTDGL
jgi:hypothetical protein